MEDQMRQYAPYPYALQKLVEGLQYPGWTFELKDIKRDAALILSSSTPPIWTAVLSSLEQ